MLPNLIHPIPIQIQQLALTETIQDEDLREPVQQAVNAATKMVNGQVKWGMEKSLSVRMGGVTAIASGYVLFRYVDLLAQSISLALNDRIIKTGFLEVDVYIIRLQPMAHYPDQGGPSLLKAYFADRAPGRQRLDL